MWGGEAKKTKREKNDGGGVGEAHTLALSVFSHLRSEVLFKKRLANKKKCLGGHCKIKRREEKRHFVMLCRQPPFGKLTWLGQPFLFFLKTWLY